ncbi:hypothetical protein J2125_004005 [Erwinia toletana]|uniref:Uncharacterized protein n=1 Tax=Winslowiella toletana TaxID=92490 RepID=A0ABS4PDU9_9GAMM|nr:hypothetical protein [Winslowiella toletana]MBP2170813.1 hypothetical protein [Winslowiella toletana]
MMADKVTFNLSYNELIFLMEDMILDCLDQIRTGQPDPHLWMERAHTTRDVWYSLACAGGFQEDMVEADYLRLLAMTDGTKPHDGSDEDGGSI